MSEDVEFVPETHSNVHYAERNELDGINKIVFVDGKWYKLTMVDPKTVTYVECGIHNVSNNRLVAEWEDLVKELSEKEVDLSSKKEEYANKEFEIVFMSDIDFKALYGSTSEKVRKEHAKNELSKLDGEIKALEFGINWIRQYIPLLKEVIRVKGR